MHIRKVPIDKLSFPGNTLTLLSSQKSYRSILIPRYLERPFTSSKRQFSLDVTIPQRNSSYHYSEKRTLSKRHNPAQAIIEYTLKTSKKTVFFLRGKSLTTLSSSLKKATTNQRVVTRVIFLFHNPLLYVAYA